MSTVTNIKGNSEWQVELEKFKKSKNKEPVFLTTDLTPTDADFLLEDNDHNRHMLDRMVNRFVRFMKEDKWMLNGECIKISSEGLLMDGQHRLEAIRRFGKPVRMSIAIGVAPETFAVNDTGRSRHAGDILSIAGYKNSNANAAALRYLLWYQQAENFSSNLDIAPNDILKAMERWPHIKHFVYPAVELAKLAPASSMQFFMYVTQTIDPELSYDFFARLESGENLSKTSPILALREMLLKFRMNNMSLDKRHLMATLIITWNAFVENTRPKTVRWDGKTFPVITGVDRKKLFRKNSGFGAGDFQ